MVGKIIGTGSYIPEKYLDNNDLAKTIATSDKWIRERTGIIRRHVVETETTVSMAATAADNAIQNSGINVNEIELILFCTVSSDVILPSAACEVQRRIGAVNATAFDLNAACAGFVFAYVMAQGYIAAKIYRTILIIGSESLSKLVDWKDRSTCILFGDGAGAAVIRAAAGQRYLPVTGSDGESGLSLTLKSRFWEEEAVSRSYIGMDGQAIFKFAVKKVPQAIKGVLKKNRIRPQTVDWFILHQANQRIIDAIVKRLGISEDKFPSNVAEYGNTSSASIPILLDEMVQKGLLKKGQKIVLAGFGAGLSWGAVILKW